MIECRKITKSFSGKPALEDVSINIKENQIYGIIGPNGAGKTTLCRIIAGLIKPDSGEFSVFGLEGEKHIEKIRSMMGYMPQIFSLYGDLTVMENLKFFANIYGVTKKDFKSRVSNLLSFTRLLNFKDRQAGKLSGGMYKKLALACSLIYRPKLLLLDEPTIGVDPVSRRELWDILSNLIEEGITIVFTTSYMDEADRCNNVCMLQGGKVVEEGRPAKLKEAVPLNGYKLVAENARLLFESVSKVEGVFNVDIMGNELNIYFKTGTDIKEDILKVIKENNAGVIPLEEIKPGFEEVFLYYKGLYGKHNSN
jgi:ABC-2 type transport system ATP-binding protein